MGTRKEELQASVELTWALACEVALEGTDLRADIEYGRSLLLAAPELLESLVSMLEWLDDGNRVLSDSCLADVNKARQLIAKAKGEST